MYCECGCGQRTSIITQTHRPKGLVKGEHRRFINGHHVRGRTFDWDDNDEGCWLWKGAVNKSGYAFVHVPNELQDPLPKTMLVHRLFFWLENGYIPEGDVDHTCENILCFNPDHLVECDPLMNQIYMRVKRVLTNKRLKINANLLRSMIDEMMQKIEETSDQDDDDED